jgi:hypothetical protein
MLSDWSRIAFLFGSLHQPLRIFLNSAYPRKGQFSLQAKAARRRPQETHSQAGLEIADKAILRPFWAFSPFPLGSGVAENRKAA